MFRAIILPIFRSTRLCVTACGIMHPRCCRPVAGNIVGALYHKFYKVVARPTLLYGSETWVTTTRDMTCLEATGMRFVRSVKGYTRLDKVRNGVIRKELEISGIQDVRCKHKQNWINYLERMENTRLPKHALKYKPRGRRDRGRPRKRWQRVDVGTGLTT